MQGVSGAHCTWRPVAFDHAKVAVKPRGRATVWVMVSVMSDFPGERRQRRYACVREGKQPSTGGIERKKSPLCVYIRARVSTLSTLGATLCPQNAFSALDRRQRRKPLIDVVDGAPLPSYCGRLSGRVHEPCDCSLPGLFLTATLLELLPNGGGDGPTTVLRPRAFRREPAPRHERRQPQMDLPERSVPQIPHISQQVTAGKTLLPGRDDPARDALQAVSIGDGLGRAVELE